MGIMRCGNEPEGPPVTRRLSKRKNSSQNEWNRLKIAPTTRRKVRISWRIDVSKGSASARLSVYVISNKNFNRAVRAFAQKRNLKNALLLY